MKFTIQYKDEKSDARAGLLQVAHGNISTPIFMPVGTSATVKAASHKDLETIVKAEIILANTYHLYLRPGLKIIEESGGLHRFMSWEHPTLTDSGGYQVYSLSKKRKIKDNGVYFKSHLDGSSHLFTPESVIEAQKIIGSDIVMAFDECTPYPCGYNYAKSSMELTHQWLDRCISAFNNHPPKYDHEQILFPIVQGSIYPELRKQSADYIANANLEGNAIGGLSVGEPEEDRYAMTDLVCRQLPDNKPRYLMGVGTPANILECIALGVDMFDCVMPTRNARNGMLFTTEGIINIRNEKWKDDFTVIDPNLQSYPGNRFHKAYLRHLIISKEILGIQIATLQNLNFYHWLVSEAREQIRNNNFAHWKNNLINKISQRL